MAQKGPPAVASARRAERVTKDPFDHDEVVEVAPPRDSGDGFGAGVAAGLASAPCPFEEENGAAAEDETRMMPAPATNATAMIPTRRTLNDM
jgi:hypothetical protein